MAGKYEGRDKRYATRQWRDRTQPAMLASNPLCQWVDPNNEVQCRAASSVVHHITDPKEAPDAFYDWANLVAVCAPITKMAGERGW